MSSADEPSVLSMSDSKGAESLSNDDGCSPSTIPHSPVTEQKKTSPKNRLAKSSPPLDSSIAALLEEQQNKCQALEKQLKETAKENRKLRQKLQRSECDRVDLEKHYESREGMFKLVLQELEAAQAEKEKQNQELNQALQQLRLMQGKLVESEKMSALGVLVAGIAHEINNPIGFIHGNVEIANAYLTDLVSLIKLYQQHYPSPHAAIAKKHQDIDFDFLVDDTSDLLQSMKVGSNRIREIVLSLRTFSRHDEAEFKTADIHQGIDSTLMILQHRLKANGKEPAIVVQKEYGSLPPIPCLAGPLNQVFMNILSNGIDALRDTQQWIPVERVDNQYLEKQDGAQPTIWIKTDVKPETNTISIKMGNNGPPIPGRILNRLFEPFFTTKSVGKGTGLGLSISYQIIVDRHHGQLKCLSSPTFGSEFLMEIPF